MSGIFHENNMRQSLEEYVPDGKTLTRISLSQRKYSPNQDFNMKV
jgi:hypothetical protein